MALVTEKGPEPVVEIQWVATGIVILIASLTASWKLAGLRGDVSEKWGERVDLARAGLSEQGAECLRTLKKEISALLGVDDTFDPLTVVADPASIRSEAKRFLKLIKLRDGVRWRYGLLLTLGPALLGLSIAFELGVVLAFGSLAGILGAGWVAPLGWVLILCSGVIGVAGFSSYAYSQHYLSVAETLSRRGA